MPPTQQPQPEAPQQQQQQQTQDEGTQLQSIYQRHRTGDHHHVHKTFSDAFAHHSGGSQEGSERALWHLTSHDQRIKLKNGEQPVVEMSDYKLEEVDPKVYKQKLVDESKLIDGISPKKGLDKPKEVDPQDKGTPDEWIARRGEYVRQVGRHPMNAEMTTDVLFKQGLITPNAYHYIRNHGSVAKTEGWEKHKIKISGLVEHEKEISMKELLEFPSVNIPVTITCDGNRRKELNTIKKTRGNAMGPGSTSCAYWKGARLCDVLRACGVKGKKDGAKYVCFTGGDKLAKGPYETSFTLSYAMDEENDVLIAYEMNNEPLPPDHGSPVRLVVPGYVGGRHVKWLSEIKVTTAESNNYYHLHDNKVLPPTVDNNEAVEAGWWENPDFTLYELCVNSVIVSPPHGTKFEMHKLPVYPIPIEGFAYSGGGRKITRVELTLDGGLSWRMCEVTYPHDVPRHENKYWTWCFWIVFVEPWQLMRATEIAVRAVDSALNIQPRDPTWNLLGMMNNSWYKVKLEISNHPTPTEPDQPPTLKFNHPVMPGAMPGGWMIRPADQPLRPRGDAWNKGEMFTREEVAKHNNKDDAWLIFRGEVYNVTSYLHDHPGGDASILASAGADATVPFEMAHGADVYKFLGEFKIGTLKDSQPADTEGYVWVAGSRELSNVAPVAPPKVALSRQTWLSIKLTKKEEVSPDTKIFTFKRDKTDKPFGLPIGQYVLLGAVIGNKLVTRPYTPTHPVFEKEDKGEISFVIKVYYPEGEKPGGLMTMHLDKLEIGAVVKLRGPFGHVFYEGNADFLIHDVPLYGDRISIIAGGSGITPGYQIIRHICEDAEDNTEIRLLFANKTVKDILLRKELDELAAKHKNFKVWYTVSDTGEEKDWKFSKGVIDKKMIAEHTFKPAVDSFAFVCGPPPMIAVALRALHDIGFGFNNLVEF